MSILDDQDKREAREAEEKRAAKFRSAKFRKAVQGMFESAEGRFVLHEFLTVAGVDVSALRANQLDTGHAIGWQDAGGWWLNAIRQHCPEREGQMRKEAREAARVASQDTDDE